MYVYIDRFIYIHLYMGLSSKNENWQIKEKRQRAYVGKAMGVKKRTNKHGLVTCPLCLYTI